MKIKYFIILLFITSSFSQKTELTVKQIDSICNFDDWDKTTKSILEGIINVSDKRKKIIGEGGFSISLYSKYTDEKYFDSLTNNEKRKYIRKKEFIKGVHHQVIHYKNSFTENRYTELYYKNQELSYIKLKFVRTENKEDKILNFEFSKEELDNLKSIKNEFLFEVKPWIIEKNNEIQYFLKKE